MARKYYRLLYRLDGTEGFLLWFSDAKEGIFITKPGSVPSFATETDLLCFADRNGLCVNTEAALVLHNLDAVQAWIANPRADTLDCVETLNAWNLFSDLASSVPSEGAGFARADGKLKPVYDRVFWGNNLSAVTPKRKRYEPIKWTQEELSHLTSLLSTGLELFRSVRQDAV